MTEQIYYLNHSTGKFGILTKADIIKTDTCLLFINSGYIHRIGPNRIYVKIARIVSDFGLSSFRSDLSGIGDNQNLNEEKNYVQEVKDTITFISDILKYKNLILLGICSGAELAYFTALNDKRISGLILINGIYLDGSFKKQLDPILNARIKSRYYKKNLSSIDRWIKLVTGKSNFFKNFTFLNLFFPIKTKKVPVSKSFNSTFPVADIFGNMKILAVFSEGSESYDFYQLFLAKQFRNCNNIQMKIYKNVDHIFTEIDSQNELVQLILNWYLNDYKIN